MLSVENKIFRQSVIMLHVVIKPFMLSVKMLNVIMLSVENKPFELNAIMLNVV